MPLFAPACFVAPMPRVMLPYLRGCRRPLAFFTPTQLLSADMSVWMREPKCEVMLTEGRWSQPLLMLSLCWRRRAPPRASIRIQRPLSRAFYSTEQVATG